jgi:hypothetical protein
VSAVEIVLAAAALVIGLTGAWSPCGFSMVETIGLAGEPRRRAATLASCATFAPGAVVGGTITFGGLALLGGLVHGVGGDLAYLVAAAIALVAAVAEARGTRIMPQIRRQLPESWRWTLPLPLAGGLYGVLLGLGFTTFVLSFGVWALAGVSFALGEPTAGLAIGLAFGLGRATPVLVLAPIVDRPVAIRCTELMAERPSLYRGLRVGDAVALVLAAVVLTSTATAGASRQDTAGGADPSANRSMLAFQLRDQSGVLRQGGQRISLPGNDPAVGGPFVAVISGGERISLLARGSLEERATAVAKGVDAVALSENWLVYRVARPNRDVLKRRPITGERIGGARTLAQVKRPSQIGQPDLHQRLVVWGVATRKRNSVVYRRLGRRPRTGTVVSSRSAGLSNPSIHRKRVLYVRAERKRRGHQSIKEGRFRQRLMLTGLRGNGRGRQIYSRRGKTTLWSTALNEKRAYVTLLKGGDARIVSVRR